MTYGAKKTVSELSKYFYDYFILDFPLKCKVIITTSYNNNYDIVYSTLFYIWNVEVI